MSNVVKLVPLGLKVGMSTMRDKIGLPDPGKDEEILMLTASAAQPPADQADSEPPAIATQSQMARADRDAIDAAAAQIAADDWQEMTPPWLMVWPRH